MTDSAPADARAPAEPVIWNIVWEGHHIRLRACDYEPDTAGLSFYHPDIERVIAFFSYPVRVWRDQDETP